MKRKSWSIRSRIILIVVPPILLFTAYWLIGSTTTARASLNLLNAKTAEAGIIQPGDTVVSELQRERQLSAAFVAGRPDAAAALREQRIRTDDAVERFRRTALASDTLDAVTDRAGDRVRETMTAFDALANTRAAVDVGRAQQEAALAGYAGMIDAVFRAYQPLMELDDPESTQLLRAATYVKHARELLARQDTIIVLDRFTAAEQGQFSQTVGARRLLLTESSGELDGSQRDAFDEMLESAEVTALAAIENRLIEARAAGSLPVPLSEWTARRDAADQRLLAFQNDLAEALTDRESRVATAWNWRFGLTAIVGLLAIVFTVVVTLRVGSSLIRRLRGLRGAALDLSENRLPSVVRRLRRGEDVDVAAEAPALEFGDDEIGQVGHAFSAAQRTAVESAIQEARVRNGLNQVFLNIARRSQTLLHRQLTILDRMERRATDPDELEDLFRVDHLATRMRRHAEDLVILAGATPGRGWRQPVPLVDVVRGAVSEVEDYARVQVLSVPDAALIGRAVTDLIHLLAELLENATSYSPPHTKVNVLGQLVPNGFVVEIEDRGLGMTDEQLSEANARLRQPPEFDPANSARLGLFVVALLAAKLGAQVTLRPSPYGGITTVVLVPPDLIADAPEVTTAAQQRALEAQRARSTAGPESKPLVIAGGPPLEPAPALAASAAKAPAALHARPAPADAAPAAPSGASASSTEVGGVTEDGLPRRVRRPVSPAPEPVPTDDLAQPVSQRPPEQTRAMMSAFQAGLARGRRDAGTTPDEPERES